MKPPRDRSNKLLIALPFWAGDRTACMKLARLMADLESEHCQHADIVFVARFDTKPDDAVVRQVSRRFNVFTHRSGRRETGWPAGCNGLFFGTMEYFHGVLQAKRGPWYKALLICEADTIPLTRNWIKHLSFEWDTAANLEHPVHIAGAMVGGAEFGREHINGGAVMLGNDPKFLQWLTKTASGFKTPAGWDWALNAEFAKWGWANIPSMRSHWNRQDITIEHMDALIAEGVVLLHGVKNDSLLRHARTRLIG